MIRRLFTPSRKRFARIVINAIQKAGLDEPVTYDPEQYAVTIGEGEDARSLFFERVYADFCHANARSRKELIGRMVAMAVRPMPKPSNDFDEAKSRIIPRVKDRHYYEILKLKNDFEVANKKLADHLAVEIVYDCSEAWMSVTHEYFNTWGVSFDEAMAIARDNLWSISNEPFNQPAPGLYVSPWQDNHDASRLILHDLIWQLKVKGDHVAMAPHRDFLIVTGSEDESGLLAMAQLTDEVLDDPRALSGIPVRLDGSEWRSYVPELPAFRNLRNLSNAGEYNEQRDVLNDRHQETGEDIFVAECIVFQDEETGEIVSRASWAEGVDTLLPIVDEIMLVGSSMSEDEMWLVKWDQALENSQTS